MVRATHLHHLLILSALLLLISACATEQSLVGKATGKYCTDSDNGNNKDVPGTMRYSELRNGVWTDMVRTDSCEPDGTLKEYWCNPPNNGTKILHACACESTATGAKCKTTTASGCSKDLDCDTFQRCNNGVCRDDPSSKDYECKDDDGGWEPYKKGTVEQARERREDRCESNTLLKEWFCETGVVKWPFTSVMTYRYEGKYGYICENGELKVDPTLGCVDDDYDPSLGGKNPKKGGTTRLTVNGRTQVQPDRCKNAATLVEYACIGSGASMALQYYEIDCDWRSESCVVNQCVPDATKRCVDSDGDNVFTPGVVTDDGRSYPDRCDSLGRIIEWYCKNEYEGDQKPAADCPYNYVRDATKGACVPKPSTTPPNTTPPSTAVTCKAFSGYIEMGTSREFDSCAFGNIYLRKTSCSGNEPRAEYIKCPTQCIQARCY